MALVGLVAVQGLSCCLFFNPGGQLKSKILRIMRALSGLLLVLAMVIPVVSHAEDAVAPASVVLDGQEFKRDQLERAFFSSVFTKDILNDAVKGKIDFGLGSYVDGGSSLSKYISQNFPWLHPHIFPQTELPKILAINKWVKPVQISFGMPNDMKPLSNQENKQFRLLFSPHDSRTLSDVDLDHSYSELLSDMSSKLGHLSGISVRYFPPQQETTQDFANIRINFLSSENFNRGHYRIGDVSYMVSNSWGGSETIYFRGKMGVVSKIKNGFPFTSGSRNQVEGYILTNEKNEIQMSICNIWDGHSPDLTKALIHECVIRSMGFTGAVRLMNPVPLSFLSSWNDKSEWPEKYRDQIKQPTELSEFDKFMIRTLYNPEIKPGMDYIQVQGILGGGQ